MHLFGLHVLSHTVVQLHSHEFRPPHLLVPWMASSTPLAECDRPEPEVTAVSTKRPAFLTAQGGPQKPAIKAVVS